MLFFIVLLRAFVSVVVIQLSFHTVLGWTEKELIICMSMTTMMVEQT